jgi:hypothetical protein
VNAAEMQANNRGWLGARRCAESRGEGQKKEPKRLQNEKRDE